MTKLSALQNELTALDGAAIWFSNGKESRLLAEAAVAAGLEPPLVCFDEFFAPEQRRRAFDAVHQLNLKVFSYPPRGSVLVGDGNGNISLISHYAVDAKKTMPVVRDLIDDTDARRCSIAIDAPVADGPVAPVTFPVSVLGTRREDRHPLFGDIEIFEPEFIVGSARFVCPLYEWTEAEVYEALAALDVRWVPETDFENTGNIAACRKCLTMQGEITCPQTGGTVTALDWSPTGNLSLWRQAMEVL